MTQQAPLEEATDWATAYGFVVREAADLWLQTGAWPTVDVLGRAALRRDEPIDVFEALRRLPPPLGRVQHDGRVVLRVRALVMHPGAKEVLNGFLRALKLGAMRLISDEDGPALHGRDLTEVLQMSPTHANRVGQVLLGEDWMFGGGSGDANVDWERLVNERTRFVMGVKDLDDYLQVEGQHLWAHPLRGPSTGATATQRERDTAGHPDPPTAPALDAFELDQLIATTSAPLVADGHYDSAVRAGAIALRDLLRELTGLSTLDGQDLAGAALGGRDPRLVLADLATRVGRGEQEGWLALAKGCFGALRNPVAHRHAGYDRVSALEALATMSLVARRLRAAQQGAGEK